MKKLLPALSLLLIPMTLHAQPQQQSPITIEQAFSVALEDNPDIKASMYEQQSAAAERKAAVGLRMPKIGLTGAYVYTQKKWGYYVNDLKTPVSGALDFLSNANLLPVNVEAAAQNLLAKDWGITILQRDFGFLSGNITVPIFTGGKINAANNAAAINVEMSQTRGDETRNSLMSQVVERYYGLVVAMEAVQVAEQLVETMNHHLQDAIALEENGMISHAERLLFEVKAVEAQRDLLTARNQVENIKAALGTTLNLKADYDPTSEIFVLRGIESLEYFQDMARTNSPLLRQVSLSRDLAMENLRLERSEYYPQIAALGGISIVKHNLTNKAPRWAVGAGLKFNIFDGLTRENKIRSAKYTVGRVESLEEKAENELEFIVEKLYNDMDNVINQVASLDKSLEFAGEYARIQRVGFREGAVPASDMIDAELNLSATRLEKITLAYTYDVMLSKLLEASGISELFPAYAKGPQAEYISLEK